MKALHCPNIVQLFKVIGTPQSWSTCLEVTCETTYRLMSQMKAQDNFQQLISAVNFCHVRCIIHRDLKSQSVVFNTDMDVKITNFGFSMSFHGRKLSKFCGSPTHAVRKLFLCQPYDGPVIDIWSLGAQLYRNDHCNPPTSLFMECT